MRSYRRWMAPGAVILAVGLGATAIQNSIIVAIPPIAWTLGITALLAGAALGLHGSRAATVIGIGLSGAPLALTAVNIAIGIARNPTSHNLFPFELLGALAIGLVPAAGLAIGRAIPRGRFSRYASVLSGALAALLAISSPAISRVFNSRQETSAEDTLRRLLAAENEYRAANPDHRFTCEGPLLPGFQRERWFAWTQLGLNTRDHFQGPGGYWFTLRCGPLSRGDDVSIEADKGFGNERLSISASGDIRREQLTTR